MYDKMVGLCTDPAGSLLWSRRNRGAPCLRDLATVLLKKFIFGHWVRRDNMVLREGRREMQREDGKMSLKWRILS